MEKKSSNYNKTDSNTSAEWHPFAVWENKIRPVSRMQNQAVIAKSNADPESTGSWKALPESV